MPVSQVLLAQASCCQGMLLLVLLAGLSRWEPFPVDGVAARSCPNKLVSSLDLLLEFWCCVVEMVAVNQLVFFRHRGDGDGDYWSTALLRSTRHGAAFLPGVHEPRPRFVKAIHGHRSHSVLWCHAHCRFFNLQAGVPIGRPFCVSVTMLTTSPLPSGLVPDDGAGGRDVERILFCNGEGFDCVFYIFFGVLFVKSKGLVVICFFP